MGFAQECFKLGNALEFPRKMSVFCVQNSNRLKVSAEYTFVPSEVVRIMAFENKRSLVYYRSRFLQ